MEPKDVLDFEAKLLKARQDEVELRRSFIIDVLNSPAVYLTVFYSGIIGSAALTYLLFG